VEFTDKVSVITGASQGIGETLARMMAREGALAVLLDIQQEKLESVVRAIRADGGRAAAYAVDVGSSEQAVEVIKAILTEHGHIDHLVNNAGITRDNLLMRMKEEEWDSVIRVNLTGVFNLCKSVIRSMMNQRSGRIVNLASVSGVMGNVGQANYSASKAGVIGLTKTLAREAASRGITVNAVAPGYIATPMTARLSESIKNQYLDIIPLKRFGTPEDVAQAVRFLLSDAAAYITGEVIHVNGGMRM